MKIPFSWTAPALLAGHKTVTRREWKKDYARNFKGPGQIVEAVEPVSEVKIATLRLTAKPTLELNGLIPDSDFEAEGFAWLEQHPEALPPTHLPLCRLQFDDMRILERDRLMWVVRFELIAIGRHYPPVAVQDAMPFPKV